MREIACTLFKKFTLSFGHCRAQTRLLQDVPGPNSLDEIAPTRQNIPRLGSRLAAGLQTLDLRTVVRIHPPQPMGILFFSEKGIWGINQWKRFRIGCYPFSHKKGLPQIVPKFRPAFSRWGCFQQLRALLHLGIQVVRMV